MSDKLDIYKTAVEMADRVSARRMAANGFFLTLNTTLVTILGFMYGQLADDKRAVLIFMSAVGIVMAFAWFFAIRSYKRLNKAKYEVINEIETELPYKIFTDEWKKLKGDTTDEPKGWRKPWVAFKDRYTDLTNIEGIVPIVFGLIYVLVMVGALLRIIIK